MAVRGYRRCRDRKLKGSNIPISCIFKRRMWFLLGGKEQVPKSSPGGCFSPFYFLGWGEGVGVVRGCPLVSR